METAVCNLASISLPRFVREKAVPFESHPSKLAGSKGSKNRYFDKLAEVTAIVTVNLNKIIDVNYYPVESAKTSNLRHRPIGIGVQGLADTFILLGMSFDSPEAQQLNKDIFETIYYHALKSSSELASKEGPYETYQGCPVSKGILQPDILMGLGCASGNDITEWNQKFTACCPNAYCFKPSTRQILGNNECFEPYTSNIYSRRVLSGEFVVVNKHLLHDLIEMGLWSPALKNKIIYEDGSVQKIPQIPDDLKAIYRTVWGIKQRTLVDMAVDRGCYIDQSQSGEWISGFMANIGTGEVLQAEAWGLFHGLQLATALHINKLDVDSDSANLVTLLNSENVDLHPLGTVLLNCKMLMSQFDILNLKHIHREGNVVADILAKECAACFWDLHFSKSS